MQGPIHDNNAGCRPGPGVYRFSVDPEAAGQRLDQFIGSCPGGFSRSLARRLIELGGVHLAGRRMRRSGQLLAGGEAVEVFIDGQPLDPRPLTDADLLYRDEYLAVLNKPVGMATQPTPARYRGTVYDGLQRLLPGTHRGRARVSIGMVQRLDRDTSGVMVFSIHQRAHKELTRQFRERLVEKRYWAIVAGCLPGPSGIFTSQLARRRSTNRTVSVERGGKPAETRYRVLLSNETASLVEVELVTGRSHQIRAHFSEAGFPLLGDTFYGGPGRVQTFPVPRQMLHARTLDFTHPVTGKDLSFRAPLPEDFAGVLEQLFTAEEREILPKC